MARTTKRVPPVITKILKAVEEMPTVDAAEALQEAARFEGSVDNRVLLLQARIKLLQDSQKPKRPPRKRKRKPPKVEKPVEPAPEPEKEENQGTVTSIDLDSLGALFGAVERSAAEPDAPEKPAKPAKPDASGAVDFGDLDALLAEDDGDDDAPEDTTKPAPAAEIDFGGLNDLMADYNDAESGAAGEIDMSALAELAAPETPATPAKPGGAIEMPDLTALDDLGSDDADADDDGSDDLAALMAAMNENGTDSPAQPDEAVAPAEDIAEPPPAPAAASLPDLSALEALGDAPEKDAAEADDLSALMGALTEEDGAEAATGEAPQATDAPDLSALDALEDAPDDDGTEQPHTADPDPTDLPAAESVASEDQADDTDGPDYSEFEALMGNMSLSSDQDPVTEVETASREEQEIAPEPAAEATEPQDEGDVQEVPATDMDAAEMDQSPDDPEPAPKPDFSEFDALMDAAGSVAMTEDISAEAQTAPEAELSATEAEAPETPDLSVHDALGGDAAFNGTEIGAESKAPAEEAEPLAASDQPEAVKLWTLEEPEDAPAVSPPPNPTDALDLSALDDLDDVTEPAEPQAVPDGASQPVQPADTETTAASFAEGKKKATLDDLYNLFPKGAQ